MFVVIEYNENKIKIIFIEEILLKINLTDFINSIEGLIGVFKANWKKNLPQIFTEKNNKIEEIKKWKKVEPKINIIFWKKPLIPFFQFHEKGWFSLTIIFIKKKIKIQIIFIWKKGFILPYPFSKASLSPIKLFIYAFREPPIPIKNRNTIKKIINDTK